MAKKSDNVSDETPAVVKEKKKKKPAKKAKSGPTKAILVESPTKIKTIKKFVDSSYKVLATKGHIVDLPKSRLGVDIENNFEPSYTVLKDKKPVLKELKEELKSVDEIYLAADPDREGEAICWHVAAEIRAAEKKLGPKTFKRVLFNEITSSAVLKSLENPMEINLNLVNAQQARRVLDRLVGYKISPFLWSAIRKGLSAGRVQSVALKLITDRQAEIEGFKPEEYWSIEALFEKSTKENFKAKLAEINGVKADIKEGGIANSAADEIKKQQFTVTEVIRKERKRKPFPPFITSTLQQDAARKFRYTAQKTMMIAQQLYEGIEIAGEGQVGLITYMRTDSLRVADEARLEAEKYIKEKIGPEFYPETPNFYKSKKSAQDAHEAIRPSSVFRSPEVMRGSLDADQFRVYTLIWKRFVASQMSPAVFDDTKAKLNGGSYLFTANGSIKKFEGFLAVYAPEQDKDEQPKPDQAENETGDIPERDARLPELSEGEAVNLSELIPNQHFTQPPPSFSDASLVKALEEKDIGRPSTYAPIISTLVYRKYIERDRGRFKPTELGLLVSGLLSKHFSDIINEEFTAKMEDGLDSVEEGAVEWKTLIGDFYKGFNESLERARPHLEDIKKEIQTETGEICEKCGAKIIVKWGRFGKFLACERYPECKNTKPADGGLKEEPMDENCPQCGKQLMIKAGPYGRYIGCSGHPECKYTRKILKKTGVACPECGGDIIERTYKKVKKFYGCSNYPKCNYMIWDRPLPEPCPKCGAPFIVEKRKKGSITTYCTKCDYKLEQASAPNE